jgi:hypothetical protein
MKPNRRWIAWVLAESARLDVALPWERGTRQPRRASARDAARA